jgi:hypothetical protein
MGSRQSSPHRAKGAARRRSRAALPVPAPEGQRLRLATPSERDDLAEYLRVGGWIVEGVGKRDLRARYPYARGDEGVCLHFSVAVWRTMTEDSLELSAWG